MLLKHRLQDRDHFTKAHLAAVLFFLSRVLYWPELDLSFGYNLDKLKIKP
jgi:hypothetical protein